MSDHKVRFEKDGAIGILTFDNPRTLNALDFQVLEELNAIMDGIERDRDVRCLIVTGAGEKAFIAGGDIAVQLTFTVQAAYDWACLGHRTLRRIETLPFPVIGAVNGYALGGGTEVALVCDLLLASEQAIFGQPEVALGIIPGFGGTQRLPRKIGVNKAKELLLTGRRFDAAEALALGLVNEVLPPDQLMARAREIARAMTSLSFDALRLCKIAVDEGLQCDLDRGLAMERGVFSQCFATARQKEEMQKFVDRGNRPKRD